MEWHCNTSLHGREGGGSPQGLFNEAPLTSQRPCLQTQSQWGLGFHICLGWGAQISGLQKKRYWTVHTNLDGAGKTKVGSRGNLAEPRSSHKNNLLRMPPGGCCHLTAASCCARALAATSLALCLHYSCSESSLTIPPPLQYSIGFKIPANRQGSCPG